MSIKKNRKYVTFDSNELFDFFETEKDIRKICESVLAFDKEQLEELNDLFKKGRGHFDRPSFVLELIIYAKIQSTIIYIIFIISCFVYIYFC